MNFKLKKVKAMMKRFFKRNLKPEESQSATSTDPTSNSQIIYIRVQQSLIQVIGPVLAVPTDPTTSDLPPSVSQSSGHLYLIEGSIDDIRRYAGTTVDWIIKVAHSICDPSGRGQIYTHTTGAPSDWYNKDRDADWRKVVPGDPLLSGIYVFESASPITLVSFNDLREL